MPVILIVLLSIPVQDGRTIGEAGASSASRCSQHHIAW